MFRNQLLLGYSQQYHMARDVTIDIMKGIGIMAVIAGHTNPDIITSKILLSFHMPSLFLISGYSSLILLYAHTLEWSISNINQRCVDNH